MWKWHQVQNYEEVMVKWRFSLIKEREDKKNGIHYPKYNFKYL